MNNNRVITRLKKKAASELNCKFFVEKDHTVPSVRDPQRYAIRIETSGLIAQTSDANDIAKTLNINNSDFESAVKQHGGSINPNPRYRFCTFTTTEQAQAFIDNYLVPAASGL